MFSCFKQFPLNNKQKLEFPHHLIDRERLLSRVVIRIVNFLPDNPLDFHDKFFQYQSF